MILAARWVIFFCFQFLQERAREGWRGEGGEREREREGERERILPRDESLNKQTPRRT